MKFSKACSTAMLPVATSPAEHNSFALDPENGPMAGIRARDSVILRAAETSIAPKRMVFLECVLEDA